MEKASTARPDLSALPRDVRVRIAVAETQGATWAPSENPASAAEGEAWLTGGGLRGICYLRPDGKTNAARAVPDYLTDPAAWGALMEKEGVALMPTGDGSWLATVPQTATKQDPQVAAIVALGRRLDSGGALPAPVRFWEGYVEVEGVLAVQDTPGEAVCAAILMKDGIDWPWATPEPVA